MHWLTKHHLEIKRQALNPQPMIEVSVLQIDPTEELPAPANPTAFWCGSQEKVALMRQRVERGESAFHPDDSVRKIVPRWDVWGKRVPLE